MINAVMVLSIFISLCGHAQLTEVTDFGQNPGNLEMTLYLPEKEKDSVEKMPLVVALHGCSQNSKTMAEQAGWNELADKYHFAVLYPDQKRVNNGSNCFNWFELEDIQPVTGETESIMNMLRYTLVNYEIDSNAVYVYGLSAGAAMSVSLMANYPDLFVAGAIFAGGAYKLATTKGVGLKAMMKVIDKTPQEWGELVNPNHNAIVFPKLIVCHGEKDKTVDIQNSYELIEQWTNLCETDTIPDTVYRQFEGCEVVDKWIYTDSLRAEKVVFYKIKDLGHALPVDPGTGERQGGETGVFAKDIDFFSTYYVAKDFGLIK